MNHFDFLCFGIVTRIGRRDLHGKACRPSEQCASTYLEPAASQQLETIGGLAIFTADDVKALEKRRARLAKPRRGAG